MEVNFRVALGLARYVRDRRGPAALQRVANATGTTPERLLHDTSWVTYAELERVLSAYRAEIPTEDEFMVAAAWKLEEAYGPLRYLLLAMTPTRVFTASAARGRAIDRVCTAVVTRHGPTYTAFRYSSGRPETREHCLLRLGQGRALPTLWGLPRARVYESKCIARGDDTCEYEYRYLAVGRWLPPLAGVVAGLGVALSVRWLGDAGDGSLVAWPAVGFLLGAWLDQRRVRRENFALAEDVVAALTNTLEDANRARLELLLLRERQDEWTSRVEARTFAQTQDLEALLAQAGELRAQRETAIRGLSHDLRTPLTVLSLGTERLRRVLAGTPAQGLVSDHERAVQQMAQMITGLMTIVTSGSTPGMVEPSPVPVAKLVDRARRLLDALVTQTELTATVTSLPSAPEVVTTDALAFDRVVDNLISNAVKYTERGRIDVEVSGDDGGLVFRIDDTGRGIRPEVVASAFQFDPHRERTMESYGVGLPVVRELVERLGARLEVWSAPGEGTTIQVRLPTRPAYRSRMPPLEILDTRPPRRAE